MVVPAPRRGFLAAVNSADWLLLSAVTVCLLVNLIRPSAAMDEDLWWHLRTGQWILQHHTVPRTVLFQPDLAGHPAVAYSWLFDAFEALAYQVAGLRGTLMLTAALVYLIFSSILGLASQWLPARQALALTATVLIALAPLWSPRPWLFTILFFALLLSALLRERAKWSLPLLFLLWANLHVQFVEGLGVLALYCAVQRTRKNQIILITCSLATLINPAGWHLYEVVFQYARQSSALQLVSEMGALEFRHLTDWLALALILGAAWRLGATRSRDWFLIALLLATCFCGFRSRRDVWMPVLVSAAILARPIKPSRVHPQVQGRVLLPACLAVSIAAIISKPSLTPSALETAKQARFPVNATTYIREHHLAGPLYNTYDWGGYLLWSLPQLAVSVDGRANLYESDLASSEATPLGQPGWDRDPKLIRARTVILPKSLPLVSLLRLQKRFQAQYEDEQAVVFTRP